MIDITPIYYYLSSTVYYITSTLINCLLSNIKYFLLPYTINIDYLISIMIYYLIALS